MSSRTPTSRFCGPYKKKEGDGYIERAVACPAFPLLHRGLQTDRDVFFCNKLFSIFYVYLDEKKQTLHRNFHISGELNEISFRRPEREYPIRI
jgi:hypothetical protein